MEVEQLVPDAPAVAAAVSPLEDVSPTTAAVPASAEKPVAEPAAAKAASEKVAAKTPASTSSTSTSSTASAASAAVGRAGSSVSGITAEPKRKATPRLPLHLLTGRLRRILLWEDIVVTAKWAASLYAAVYLLFFNTTSLVAFTALVLLAAVLANIVYVNAYSAYCTFKQQTYEHPNQRSLDRGGLVAIDKDWALATAAAAVDELNRQSVALAQIVYCADSMTSFKAAGALYVIATVAGALPTGWLCVVALTVAFLGPAVYAKRYVDVDKVIALAEKKLNAGIAAAAAKARPVLQRLPFVKPKAE